MLHQIITNLAVILVLLPPARGHSTTKTTVSSQPTTKIDAADDDLCSSSSFSSLSQVECSGGAHIIVTRESGAPAGVSAMNVLALGVRTQCARGAFDVDITETPYPAELDSYPASEQQRVGNLTALVAAYAACCPGEPVVLLGYSQGAQATVDFLCGTSEDGFPVTEAYASGVADNVAAVVLFGDPSFVKGLSWDRGTANNTSYFPRQNTTACEPVADSMISYCDYDDLYCDDGGSIQVHASYVERYHAEAIDYVAQALNCTS